MSVPVTGPEGVPVLALVERAGRLRWMIARWREPWGGYEWNEDEDAPPCWWVENTAPSADWTQVPLEGRVIRWQELPEVKP